MITQISSLSQKAMLVGITIHAWQARKYDRKISIEVAEQHAATNDAGRFNKHLLPGNAESYEAVHKKAREFRSFYYANTLPWSKDGQRILPTANYETFSEGVRRFRRELHLLVEQFLTEYPILKEDARVLLNGMFNEQDYPAIEEMRTKFAVKVETLPLPSADDFRVALAEAEVSRIQREIETRLQREIENAHRDLWNRLHNAVDNMVVRLKDPTGKFHDTLVGNLQELVELIPKLNFTDDRHLESIRRQCAETLAVHAPQSLRDDMALRAKVAAQAQEISAWMDAYMN